MIESYRALTLNSTSSLIEVWTNFNARTRAFSFPVQSAFDACNQSALTASIQSTLTRDHLISAQPFCPELLFTNRNRPKASGGTQLEGADKTQLPAGISPPIDQGRGKKNQTNRFFLPWRSYSWTSGPPFTDPGWMRDLSG